MKTLPPFALLLALAAPTFAQVQPQRGVTDAASTSHVRVLHGIGNDVEVDVYIDGRRQRAGLTFPAITEYLPVPAGVHTVTLRAAGTPARVPPILSLRRTFAPRSFYVVTAASRAGRNLAVVTNETPIPAPPAGRASIRFYHLSPDAPLLTITSLGSRVLVRSLGRGQSQDASVGEQTFVVDVRREGPRGRRLATRSVRVRRGERYSAFVVGDPTRLRVVVEPVGR